MSLVFALGCSGGVLAIEAVFSLDVIDECLKHRVSVPEHRRGPEMVAHFRLDLADRLIFRVASGPLTAGMDRIEGRLVVGSCSGVITVLSEPVKNACLVVPDRPEHSD